MKETEQEKRDRLIRNAKEESDMEWILAGLTLLVILAFFSV